MEPIRNGKPNRKDTASAVVGYGQGYLFESAQDLSAAEFELLLDSILQVLKEKLILLTTI